MVDDDGPSRRQLAKKQRRDAGDRSGDLSRKLMSVSDSTLARLELEEELHGAVVRARAITSNTARRRAERALAGELRRFDLDDVERKLANVQSAGVAEPQLFHLAERWRTRMLEPEGRLANGERTLVDRAGGKGVDLAGRVDRIEEERKNEAE